MRNPSDTDLPVADTERHLPTQIASLATPFSRIPHAFKRFQTITTAFQV